MRGRPAGPAMSGMGLRPRDDWHMKRALLAGMLLVLVGSGSGCCLVDRMFHCRGCCGTTGCNGACAGTADCAPAGCGPFHGRGIGCALFARGRRCDGACPDAGVPSGPPTAHVTYPYYTIRGPRDFLACDPGGLESY